MAPTRRAFLAMALAGLVSASPAAAQKAAKEAEPTGEFLQPGFRMVIEYWDREGLFHLVNTDLIVVLSKEGVKVGKVVLDKIRATLASMPWEQISSGNPAITIKQVALDACRADPAVGPHVKDVLIARLMLR